MTSGDLAAFLVARRARLRPADVGLVSSGVRRVEGLRREEVALLAGVSVDYYTRLEQGRERHPSAAVLRGLSQALRLDREACDHLFRLAGVPTGGPVAPAPATVDPHLRVLLDSWPDTPAMVIDRVLDVLALNSLAEQLYADFATADNIARMTFLDPAGRTFFADWSRAADACVANLRHALGCDQHDPGLHALVGELTRGSAEFRSRWPRNDVRGKTQEAKTFDHRGVGLLTLTHHTFEVRAAPGQQLVVYGAEPGSTSAGALRLLGALAATGRRESLDVQRPHPG
ncbi:helix-turn-helix transcriptional regulator [Blastococcus montanus]|uniref:helix-turn-helix domain-containing protein n=1 Tax=Blastococcus montanus TaxID=3144973 RepID=UPI00320878D9